MGPSCIATAGCSWLSGSQERSWAAISGTRARLIVWSAEGSPTVRVPYSSALPTLAAGLGASLDLTKRSAICGRHAHRDVQLPQRRLPHRHCQRAARRRRRTSNLRRAGRTTERPRDGRSRLLARHRRSERQRADPCVGRRRRTYLRGNGLRTSLDPGQHRTRAGRRRHGDGIRARPTRSTAPSRSQTTPAGSR